jgi:hypothetical protein
VLVLVLVLVLRLGLTLRDGRLTTCACLGIARRPWWVVMGADLVTGFSCCVHDCSVAAETRMAARAPYIVFTVNKYPLRDNLPFRLSRKHEAV